MVISKFGASVQRPTNARSKLKYPDMRLVCVQGYAPSSAISIAPHLILTAKPRHSSEKLRAPRKFVD